MVWISRDTEDSEHRRKRVQLIKANKGKISHEDIDRMFRQETELAFAVREREMLEEQERARDEEFRQKKESIYEEIQEQLRTEPVQESAQGNVTDLLNQVIRNENIIINQFKAQIEHIRKLNNFMVESEKRTNKARQQLKAESEERAAKLIKAFEHYASEVQKSSELTQKAIELIGEFISAFQKVNETD